MKRDMETVRQLLLEIEELESASNHGVLVVEGLEQPNVDYHLMLLNDHGLITWANFLQDPDCGGTFFDLRMTWAGHEFLDDARNEGAWQQVRELIRDKDVKNVSFSILSQLLSRQVAASFGLQ